MKIQVKLFAAARQAAGNHQITVVLPELSSVGQLRAALTEQHPALAPWVPHLLVAVDQQYAADDQPIAAESEIACFPPVSGG